MDGVLTVSLTDPGCFTSIDAAVASAAPGATVFVRPGTYVERLRLTKSVNLSAEGAIGDVILDGGAGVSLSVADGSVNVWGFTMVGGNDHTPAVVLLGGSLDLVDCQILATGQAALRASAGTVAIEGGRISNPFGDGIVFDGYAEGLLLRTSIRDVLSAALILSGHGERLVVECDVSDVGGIGVLVSGSGHLEKCRIADVDGTGIFVWNENVATFASTSVDVVGPTCIVVAGGSPAFTKCHFSSQQGYTSVVLGRAIPRFDDCVLAATTGRGLVTRDDSRTLITACDIDGVVVNDAAHVTIRSGKVVGTPETAALTVSDSGGAALDHVELSDGDAGILATGESNVDVDYSLIFGQRTAGVRVSENGCVRIRHSILTGTTVGVDAHSAGTVHIEETQIGHCGIGARATEGAQITLVGTDIWACLVPTDIQDQAK